VWLNFWATWCPPCQSETPVLRDLDEAYGNQGLAIVGVAVQETTPDNVRAYADRYELGYEIAFDASADIFDLYRVYALPTQLFIDPDGRILEVVNGPLSHDAARARVEAWLPGAAVSARPGLPPPPRARPSPTSGRSTRPGRAAAARGSIGPVTGGWGPSCRSPGAGSRVLADVVAVVVHDDPDAAGDRGAARGGSERGRRPMGRGDRSERVPVGEERRDRARNSAGVASAAGSGQYSRGHSGDT
jgi:thiol-disulfide isomerase/thioredoxin